MTSAPPADPPNNTNTNTNTTATSSPSPHQGTLRPPKHTTVHDPNAQRWAQYCASVHLSASRNDLRNTIEENPALQRQSCALNTWWRLSALDTDNEGKLLEPDQGPSRVNVSYLTVEEMEERKRQVRNRPSGLRREVDIEGWEEGKGGGGYDGGGSAKGKGLVWWKVKEG